MPLRVLLVDSGRDWRGAQRQLLLLARGLRERGHEPLVAAHPDAPLLRRLRALGVAVAAVRMRGAWDLAAARRVRALVRVWRADVVHANDARAHAIALASLLGNPWVPLVVSRRQSAPPAVLLGYRHRVSTFVAATRSARDALLAAGIEQDRVRLVPPAVPPAPGAVRRDWRREFGWPADTIVCGVVGSLAAPPHHLLREVLRLLPPEARERLRFVLLGGPAAGAITIDDVPGAAAGYVDDVVAAEAGLDALWYSASTDGLGTTLLVAMACGVPAVAFRAGGAAEYVTDGRDGLLVAPGNVRLFARQAERMLLDASLRGALGDGCRDATRGRGAQHMVLGMEQVYESVLAGRDALVAR